MPFRTPFSVLMLVSRSRSQHDVLALCRHGERPAAGTTTNCLRSLAPNAASVQVIDAPSVGLDRYNYYLSQLGPVASVAGQMLLVTFDAGALPRLPGMYALVYAANGMLRDVPAAIMRPGDDEGVMEVDVACRHPRLPAECGGSAAMAEGGDRHAALLAATAPAASSARGGWGLLNFLPLGVGSGSGAPAAAAWHVWGAVVGVFGPRMEALHPPCVVRTHGLWAPTDAGTLHADATMMSAHDSPTVSSPVTASISVVPSDAPAANDRIVLAPYGGAPFMPTAQSLAIATQVQAHSSAAPEFRMKFTDAATMPPLPGLWQFVFLTTLDSVCSGAVAEARASGGCLDVGLGAGPNSTRVGMQLHPAVVQHAGHVPVHSMYLRVPGND
ncbi:hypothetical protein EON68_03765, partial [archaeon]